MQLITLNALCTKWRKRDLSSHPRPEPPFAGAGVSPLVLEEDWVTVLLS